MLKKNVVEPLDEWMESALKPGRRPGRQLAEKTAVSSAKSVGQFVAEMPRHQEEPLKLAALQQRYVLLFVDAGCRDY